MLTTNEFILVIFINATNLEQEWSGTMKTSYGLTGQVRLKYTPLQHNGPSHLHELLGHPSLVQSRINEQSSLKESKNLNWLYFQRSLFISSLCFIFILFL